MSYDAYATQVLAELELVPDYSTKRIVLIDAFKKMAEMERSGCIDLADHLCATLALKDEGVGAARVAQAIRQRT